MTTTCPKDTPWGRAQHIEELVPGQVWSVSTAGHGGLYVTGDALQRIPQSFRLATFTRSPQWYEEDCDWAIVARFIPEAFPDVARAKAESYLSQYHHHLLKSL